MSINTEDSNLEREAEQNRSYGRQGMNLHDFVAVHAINTKLHKNLRPIEDILF